ncbi:MAG: hypothetical protein COB53_08525, partial [Elusimicrobia bacterium]
LTRLLKSDDAGLSRAAARSLAGLGHEEVEVLLRARLDSKHAGNRIDAAFALGLMQERIGVMTLDGFLEEVDGPYADGVSAAGALAELGRTNGLAYLAELLKPSDKKWRNAAIDALGASKAPRAILPLAALLEDPSPATRLRVIEALETVGGDRAAFELRRQRDDSEPEVRRAIRFARARLGDYVLP